MFRGPRASGGGTGPKRRSPAHGQAGALVTAEKRRTAPLGTPTTSWLCSTGLRSTPKDCAQRSRAALATVGLRLNERRRTYATSRSGLISSASVCSGDSRGVFRPHLAVEVNLLDHGKGEVDNQTGNEQPTL